MKIIVAENAGFCFGVRRAIKAVYENLKSSEKVYTLGPIIHNPQVVEKLKEKGVIVEEEIENIPEGTVIVRSHGVSPEVYRQIEEKGLRVVDATCPFVKRIHHLVKEYHDNGYKIIIIGEAKHPEVIGINGWCENQAYILQNSRDVDDLPPLDRVCVVAQTTFLRQKWNEIIEKLREKFNHIKIFNTLCAATFKRQKEARDIAKRADVMFVIGGRNSSNTKRLYQICSMYCPKTFAIESAGDINFNTIRPGDTVGITAGASTPEWIIEEVVKAMNEFESKGFEKKGDTAEKAEAVSSKPEHKEEDMKMDAARKTVSILKPGQVVKGTVVRVTPEEIILNIGYKYDAVIPADQFSLNEDQPVEEAVKEGDEIEAVIFKVNEEEGKVLLSRKSLERKRIWNELMEGYKTGREFKGLCEKVVKGGVIARIKGVRAFVPASQLDVHYVEDLNTFVGQTLRLRILELDRRRKQVVASQRAVLEAEEEAKREALWNSLKEGQKITGTVKDITDFGAFVDIGGIDGLIHISDLSWGRLSHPSEVLEEGQQIEVVVLSIDREKGRVSLGYKQTLPHPWDNIEKKYPVGKIVTGKVVQITSFGAFVELEPGVDGLVHISQISDRRIKRVEDVLRVGDEVKAKVLDVNEQDRRIRLSIKEALIEEVPAPKPEEKKEERMTVTLGEFFPEELKKEVKNR